MTRLRCLAGVIVFGLAAVFGTISLADAATIQAVQSGTASSSGVGTVTVPITAVDPATSFLIFSTRHDNNRPTGSIIRGRISAANSLEFVRATSLVDSSVIDIQWYVVEYSSGVSVQRGEVTQSATTIDVTLLTPVAAVDQAFVTWSKTPAANNGGFGAPQPILAELTSTSNLQIRAGAANAGHVIWWQVIEFTDANDINVQKGTITSMGTTLSSVSATLSPPMDPDRTFVLVGYNISAGGADIGKRMLRAVLTDSATVTIDRSVTGDPVTEITWQAIELNDGSFVQGGSENFASGVAQKTVSIVSVDSSRAVPFASVQAAGAQNMGRTPYIADDILGVGSATMTIASGTQVSMDRENTSDETDIGWFVVEFGGVDADLALTKSVDDPSPNEGDTITYTVTVMNNGPDGASGVEVTDLLPVGVTYQSDAPTQGTYASGSGLWSVGTIDESGSATLTVTATVDSGTAGSLITNSATVTALDQNDSNAANDSDTADLTVQAIDLAVTKSVDDPTPNEGDTITYTVDVTNNGPDDATGVEITDSLPAGVTYQSDSPTAGSYDDGTGVWTIGPLANAVTETLTITATVDLGTADSTITNTASVTGSDQADINAGNDSDFADIVVEFSSVDVAVEKTVDDGTPSEGGTVVFTIVGSNGGPADATGVELTDLLPTGVTYQSDTTTQGSYDDVTGVWTVGTVTVAATDTLTITATVDSGTGGTMIINSAALTAVDQIDSDSGNDSDSATLSVQMTSPNELQITSDPAADQRPNWSVGDSTIVFDSDRAGDLDLWSVSSSGGGETQLTFDILRDQQPDYSPDDALIVFSSRQGGGLNPDIWLIPADGGAATLLSADSTSNDRFPTWSPDGTMVAFTRNGDVYVVPATGGPAVQVTTDPAADIHPSWSPDGTMLAFQSIRSGNNDIWTIPAAGGSATQITTDLGTDGAPDWAPTGRIVFHSNRDGSYDIWAIPASGGIAVQLTSGPENNLQPDWSRDGKKVAFSRSGNIWTYTFPTDLEVAKSVDDPTPLEGGSITYTIDLTNHGPKGATGIDVTDLVPAGLTYQSHGATQGSYDDGTGVWSVGAVPFGATATLSLTATVDLGTSGTTIGNTAAVSASDDLDADLTNDTASVDITVEAMLAISSANDQTFVEGAAASLISPIRITDDGTAPVITAANDLRVRIPAGFTMGWETGDVTATITGVAAGKVSTTVVYEDAGQTLVLDVTSDFSAADQITISDLSYANFSGASLVDNLELEVTNDDVVSALDDKTIEVLAATPVVHLAFTPKAFALETARPNPFRGRTTIQFDVPVSGSARLEIYDVAGRLVRTVLNRPLDVGRYAPAWDGRDATGRRVAAGVYFVRLKAGAFDATKRIVRLR